MDLREELPSDRQAVRDVHLRAFGDHGLVYAEPFWRHDAVGLRDPDA
jgi:hypothetical protein